MKIVIIDYGIGNIRSICSAIEKVGEDPIVSNDPADYKDVDRLILPGVGAFQEGMKNLLQSNLLKILSVLVLKRKVPILGICLGCQLMARESYEFGHCDGLGWVDGSVIPITAKRNLHLPHIGWNDVEYHNPSPLFLNIPNHSDFYFVHSYYVHMPNYQYVSAKTSYGNPITAAYRYENIYGVQFHPEKSQKYGLIVLSNFLYSV